MEKYVIFTDIDGTLLNDKHQITPQTKEALMTLQEQGHALVLASGRDMSSLSQIGQTLNIHKYQQSGYIALNGLEICDYNNQCLHKEQRFQKEDVQILSELAKSKDVDMVIFFRDCIYILEYDQNGIMEQHFIDREKYIVHDIKDIPDHYYDDIKKVAFIKEVEAMNEILEEIQVSMASQYEICKVEDNWVEINPLGATKGKALKKYIDIKNKDIKHTIAFGNGENDIDMLQNAGIGVAMSNAFDTVKNAVKYICLDNNHDGIAMFLKEMEIWR